jgi:hypothetical protein
LELAADEFVKSSQGLIYALIIPNLNFDRHPDASMTADAKPVRRSTLTAIIFIGQGV